MRAYRKASRRSAPKLEPDAKSKLQLIPAKPRLPGRVPTEGQAPGEYLSKCAAAWIKGKHVNLQHHLIDGKHDGVGLRQWIPYFDGNVISTRYVNACEIALGRPLDEDDPYDDPAKIFVDKQFLVVVGYRKSEFPMGRGTKSDEFALYYKDKEDRLKVHEIISLHDI